MADGATLRRLDDADEIAAPELDDAGWQSLLDEAEQVEAFVEETQLTPRERRRGEARLTKLADRERRTGEVQAFARLRPDDRSLIERLVGYWDKALRATKPKNEFTDPHVKPPLRQEPGWPTLYRVGKSRAGHLLDGVEHRARPVTPEADHV